MQRQTSDRSVYELASQWVNQTVSLLKVSSRCSNVEGKRTPATAELSFSFSCHKFKATSYRLKVALCFVQVCLREFRQQVRRVAADVLQQFVVFHVAPIQVVVELAREATQE